MRKRFLQVLESDEKDVRDDVGLDAVGRFWSTASRASKTKNLPRPDRPVVVDLQDWAARRR